MPAGIDGKKSKGNHSRAFEVSHLNRWRDLWLDWDLGGGEGGAARIFLDWAAVRRVGNAGRYNDGSTDSILDALEDEQSR